MLKFFEYCFYRIAFSKWYQKADKNAPYIWASGWITLCQGCNIITIITVYYIINNTKFNFEIVYSLIFIILALVNHFLFLTKNKYKKLIARYKDENHNKLKGWGVFLYVILSMLLFGYVTIKLFWVPKIVLS